MHRCRTEYDLKLENFTPCRDDGYPLTLQGSRLSIPLVRRRGIGTPHVANQPLTTTDPMDYFHASIAASLSGNLSADSPLDSDVFSPFEFEMVTSVVVLGQTRNLKLPRSSLF